MIHRRLGRALDSNVDGLRIVTTATDFPEAGLRTATISAHLGGQALFDEVPFYRHPENITAQFHIAIRFFKDFQRRAS